MPLLNKTKVREYALARAAEHKRPFRHISSKFYADLEAKLKVVINDAVHRHPTCLKRLTDVPQGFI